MFRGTNIPTARTRTGVGSSTKGQVHVGPLVQWFRFSVREEIPNFCFSFCCVLNVFSMDQGNLYTTIWIWMQGNATSTEANRSFSLFVSFRCYVFGFYLKCDGHANDCGSPNASQYIACCLSGCICLVWWINSRADRTQRERTVGHVNHKLCTFLFCFVLLWRKFEMRMVGTGGGADDDASIPSNWLRCFRAFAM